MNRSHHFANLSGLAYKKFNNKLTDQLKKLGYTNVKYIDNGGAQSMVLKNKDEQVIVFRGTEPKQFSDLKADLKAWKIQSKTDGKVHDGFYDEVEKVWSEVVKLLDDKKPLFICGHSLGGAMATVAASRLERHTKCLYTFGSPRVGNKKFVAGLTVKHFRWRNNNDLVPSVPFAWMGFRHHGTPCYFNYYGNVRNGLSGYQRFKDWWRGHVKAVSKFELFDGFRDHGKQYYIRYSKRNKL
jgi:triacylglycerol lipase